MQEPVPDFPSDAWILHAGTGNSWIADVGVPGKETIGKPERVENNEEARIK
jgi:hypothetical protein